MHFSLERNWEKDKLNMGKQVANLGDYADPVWVSKTLISLQISKNIY